MKPRRLSDIAEETYRWHNSKLDFVLRGELLHDLAGGRRLVLDPTDDGDFTVWTIGDDTPKPLVDIPWPFVNEPDKGWKLVPIGHDPFETNCVLIPLSVEGPSDA